MMDHNIDLYGSYELEKEEIEWEMRVKTTSWVLKEPPLRVSK